MILLKVLMISLMLLFGYVLLFLPAILLWVLINKLVLRKVIAKAKRKKTLWFATLFVLIGIELGCLFYINAHPFVVYDKTKISEETADKIITYVHNRPDQFKAENFGGFRLSDMTLKFKAEIIVAGDSGGPIVYELSSVPFGGNHWYFRLDENNEISIQ